MPRISVPHDAGPDDPTLTGARRVLAIGLDAVDPTLLMRWCDSGELPVIRALRDRGAWGGLAGPVSLADDAAWATFYTGVGPGRHGRFHWRRLRPDSYEHPSFQDSDLRHEAFWDVLSRQGCQVGILDVPKCPLSPTLHGFQVADWRVHGRSGSTRSTPPELAAQLIARYGDDRNDQVQSSEWLCREEQLDAAGQRVLFDRLIESVAAKRDAACDLLRTADFDLFLVVFKEGHCAGHQFWSLLDAQHALHDPLTAAELRDPIKRTYQALDAAVGELLASVSDDTMVLIFTDIGMSTNITGNPFLDEILFRVESATPHLPQWLLPSHRHIRRTARRIREQLARSRLGPAFFGREATSPHASRLAFAIEHNEISGAIRFNIAGREPAGRLRPEAAEDFARRIECELRSLRNPDTGGAIVEAVVRSERAFAGANTSALPDLFVEWKRDAPIRRVHSPANGLIVLPTPTYRSGNHIAGGLYIAAGPCITAHAEECPAMLADLAPTIGAWLNVPLHDVDGRPIAALCA